MAFEVVCFTDEVTTARWLKERNAGTGGSDAGTIMGVGMESLFTLWAEKCELVFPDEKSPSKAAEYGKWLELPIAQKFAADNNVAVVQWPVMVRNVERPWQMANVDFLLVATSEHFPAGVVTRYRETDLPPGTLAIVEVKTTGLVTYGFADAWEGDQIPEPYEWQTVHYSDVLDVPQVVVVAFIGRKGLAVRQRAWSIEKRLELRTAEEAFWELVTTRTQPELDGSDSDFETLHALYPHHLDQVTVEADEFAYDTFTAWQQAKLALAGAEKVVNGLRASLESAVGDAEALTWGKKILFTFRNNKDGQKFDTKRFAAEHPGLYEQYLETTKGARVLRPMKEGK